VVRLVTGNHGVMSSDTGMQSLGYVATWRISRIEQRTLSSHFHFEVIKSVCFVSVSQPAAYATLEDFNSYLEVESDLTYLTYWFYSWHGVQSNRIKINNRAILRDGNVYICYGTS